MQTMIDRRPTLLRIIMWGSPCRTTTRERAIVDTTRKSKQRATRNSDRARVRDERIF
jgi:hypothetical protein